MKINIKIIIQTQIILGYNLSKFRIFYNRILFDIFYPNNIYCIMEKNLILYVFLKEHLTNNNLVQI